MASCRHGVDRRAASPAQRVGKVLCDEPLVVRLELAQVVAVAALGVKVVLVECFEPLQVAAIGGI